MEQLSQHCSPKGAQPEAAAFSHMLENAALGHMLEQLCAEEATQQHDTSTLLLWEEAPHVLAAPLSEEWLPGQPPGANLDIAFFTEADWPHEALPAGHPEVQARIAAVDTALGYLAMLKRDSIPQSVVDNPNGFVEPIVKLFPDPSTFTAGSWSRYAAVWRYLFGPYVRSRAAVGPMLHAVERGIQWDLMAPAAQTAMPDHDKKMARLRNAAARVMPPAEVRAMLHSPKPRPFSVPNHHSVVRYPEFVKEAVAGLLTTGAIMQLPSGRRPLIINPLGVADNKAPKLRLVLDPIYTNLLLKYAPLRYEQLADITQYLSREDWATTTDEKSGYHHQALHPSMWTLLGFELDGTYYCFTHLPFGVGPACKAYTVVKQELYRLPRDLAGARLTFLIDDLFSVANGPHRAALQGGAIMLLQWALGFFLSLPNKGQPYPTQNPDFLGMLVDIPNLRFLLPEKKIREFKELAAQLSSSTTTTDRTLAKLAGKLVSYTPAIQLAPLYAQQLFKVMQGQAAWDALYDTPGAAADAMQWVAANLEEWNGRTWAPNREVLLVAGDYSSTHGYAAFTPEGELIDPIVITISDEVLAAVAQNRYSSTLGEIECVLRSLEVLLEHHPDLVRGKTLHYNGDNQAAMSNLSSMAGNTRLFPLVRQTWELAMQNDVMLAFTWHPREDEYQQAADHWSKITDNSQWALNNEVYDRFIKYDSRVLELGGITLDVFGDHTNAKAARFYSRHWCPGTLGVNGFLFPWAFNQVTGERELCYVNGDFSRMGDILCKIGRERANSVVVYPDWPRYWQVMWEHLPVRRCFTLPRQPDLCVPGPRVDSRKRRGVPPRYALKVAIIVWDD